jgi:hypothetical protein
LQQRLRLLDAHAKGLCARDLCVRAGRGSKYCGGGGGSKQRGGEKRFHINSFFS